MPQLLSPFRTLIWGNLITQAVTSGRCGMVLWTLPIDPLITFHFSLNIYKRIQDNIILLTVNTQIHRVHGVKNKQRTTPQWSETGSFVFAPQATTHLQPLHARHLPLWHPLWCALAGVSCTFHLDLVFFRMPLTGDSWQDRLTKSDRVTRLLSVITYKRFW